MDKAEGATTGAISRVAEAFALAADLLAFLARLLLHVVCALYRTVVPPEEKSVVGEIVLITGTGHGIGKELAAQYGDLGAEVVCVDVNGDTNGATVAELRRRGIKAHAYTCDVCSRDAVLELREKVEREVGAVTVLVNNAGVMPCKRFLAHGPEEIRKMFDVNVFAHFWMLEAFLPTMMKRDKGHVVGISSIAGLVGSPNVAPYSASKYAVRGLMEGLAEEFRTLTRHDINFTTVYPYITDTGLCKKPVIRFKSFMKILPPRETARVIVQAQRRGYKEATVPKYLFYTNNVTRLLPRSCANLLIDFLGAKLDEHD